MKIYTEDQVKKLPSIDEKKFNVLKYNYKKCSDEVGYYIVLQIHITDFCNLKCKHCYGEERKNEMTFTEFKLVVDQFLCYLEKHRLAGMISITGGEPLVHPQIREMFEYLYQNYFRSGYPFLITLLTNGTLLEGGTYIWLERYKDMIHEIQISIDGMEQVHDAIRGKGTWRKSITVIGDLLKKSFKVAISLVVQKQNRDEAIKVIELAEQLQVYRITISRMVPLGKHKDANNEKILSKEEFKKFQKDVCKIAERLIEKIANGKGHTYLMMQRCDLWNIAEVNYIMRQALVKNTPSYLLMGCSCKIGNNLMVVLPNLDMIACRRLPEVIGNLKQNELSELWRRSPILKKYRQRSNYMTGKCTQCKFLIDKKYKNICSGGGPCMAVALGQTIYDPDPMCWLEPTMIEQHY